MLSIIADPCSFSSHSILASLSLLIWISQCSASTNNPEWEGCMGACSNLRFVSLPSDAGVGHLWMGLMTAIVTAHRFGATLELSPDFWRGPPNSFWKGTFSQTNTSFEWANKYLNMNYSTDDIRSNISNSMYYVKTIDALKVQVNKHNCLSKHSPTTPRSTVLAAFGGPFCSPCRALSRPYYCGERIPGLYNRAALVIESLYSSALLPANVAQYGYADDPIVVHWHFRTGDFLMNLDASLFLSVKKAIDDHVHHRKVIHKVFTFNSSQGISQLKKDTKVKSMLDSVLHHFEFIDKYNMESVTDNLLSSHVLVSLGSSAAHIIPTLRRHSDFIHLFFPPKSCYKLSSRGGSGRVFKHVNEIPGIRSDMSFQAAFVKKGIVPLFSIGSNLYTTEEYWLKLLRMLSHLDRRESIPREVSMLSYEQSLPFDTEGKTCPYFVLHSDADLQKLSRQLCPKADDVKHVGTIVQQNHKIIDLSTMIIIDAKAHDRIVATALQKFGSRVKASATLRVGAVAYIRKMYLRKEGKFVNRFRYFDKHVKNGGVLRNINFAISKEWCDKDLGSINCSLYDILIHVELPCLSALSRCTNSAHILDTKDSSKKNLLSFEKTEYEGFYAQLIDRHSKGNLCLVQRCVELPPAPLEDNRIPVHNNMSTRDSVLSELFVKSIKYLEDTQRQLF